VYRLTSGLYVSFSGLGRLSRRIGLRPRISSPRRRSPEQVPIRLFTQLRFISTSFMFFNTFCPSVGNLLAIRYHFQRPPRKLQGLEVHSFFPPASPVLLLILLSLGHDLSGFSRRRSSPSSPQLRTFLFQNDSILLLGCFSRQLSLLVFFFLAVVSPLCT